MPLEFPEKNQYRNLVRRKHYTTRTLRVLHSLQILGQCNRQVPAVSAANRARVQGLAPAGLH